MPAKRAHGAARPGLPSGRPREWIGAAALAAIICLGFLANSESATVATQARAFLALPVDAGAGVPGSSESSSSASSLSASSLSASSLSADSLSASSLSASSLSADSLSADSLSASSLSASSLSADSLSADSLSATASSLSARSSQLPADRCSQGLPNASTSVVTWPTTLQPAAEARGFRLEASVAYTLRDSSGTPLCPGTRESAIVIATWESKNTQGGSYGGGGEAWLSVYVPAGEAASFTVTVHLAFTNATVLRGAPDAPGCVYAAIAATRFGFGPAGAAPAASPALPPCPPSIAESAARLHGEGYWRNTSCPEYTNGTWVWTPWRCRVAGLPVGGEGGCRLPRYAAAELGGAEAKRRWVVFWGDDTLLLAYKSLATSGFGAPDPFPGDRKAKFYFSKEVSPMARFHDLPDTPGLNGRLTFVGNTAPSLYGRSKTPCLGLAVLDDKAYAKQLRALVTQNASAGPPTAVVIHSGIADLCSDYQVTEDALRRRAEKAARFWREMVDDATTRVILTTTVATSGVGICHRFHVSRLRWWDGIRLGAFKAVFPGAIVVDLHALTLPFHLTNDYSDGTSYGLVNSKGRQDAVLSQFPKQSRFLAGKRYNPTVGEAFARLLLHAAVAPF
ncbi:hypothetical protein DIPPA_11262 [Diplonema papillatum]|nr:hypothetical protein DIPPA_11262 [Diplonema papillatum]